MLPWPYSLPLLLIGVTMAAYWFKVLEMARRQRRRTGKAANLIPPEPLGRALRLLWAPAIALWVVHPLVSAFWTNPPPAVEPMSKAVWLRWICAGVVLAGFVVTRRCWKRMGRSWRMGIDPAEQTQLVVEGMFAWVRHPIYALSAMMMVATMLALPSPVMLAAGLVHVSLLFWESGREERHMVRVHGPAYEAYRRRVGRFVPRSARPYSPA